MFGANEKKRSYHQNHRFFLLSVSLIIEATVIETSILAAPIFFEIIVRIWRTAPLPATF
jgi:hypothetical protein